MLGVAADGALMTALVLLAWVSWGPLHAHVPWWLWSVVSLTSSGEWAVGLYKRERSRWGRDLQGKLVKRW